MKFIAIQPSSHEELLWDQYVSQEPHATGYHMIGWRRVVEETFGHTTMYFSAMDDQGRCGAHYHWYCYPARCSEDSSSHYPS